MEMYDMFAGTFLLMFGLTMLFEGAEERGDGPMAIFLQFCSGIPGFGHAIALGVIVLMSGGASLSIPIAGFIAIIVFDTARFFGLFHGDGDDGWDDDDDDDDPDGGPDDPRGDAKEVPSAGIIVMDRIAQPYIPTKEPLLN